MDVSIIIVTYNTMNMTSECIKSIVDNTFGLEYEIILVDNGSTDGSEFRFAKDNRIIYIYSRKNLGFGRANNIGYKYAKGKYIFLLNSDTILLNNAIKIFFDIAEKSNDNQLFFGCYLEDKANNRVHSYGEFPTLSHFISHKRANESMYADPKIVDYITGADLFIKKEIIDQNNHQLFDADYFMYFEDSDLQFRYNKLGYLSTIVNGPRIAHLCNNRNDIYIRKLSLYVKGKYIYAKKHFPKYKYIALKILSCIHYPLNIFKYKGTMCEKIRFILQVINGK